MTKRSMTFGNNSQAGTNINATSGTGAHRVKGIGNVQRAASKKITGAAAVGAVVDAADESKWPIHHQKGLKPNKGTHRVKHVIPTPKDTF